MGDPSTTAQDDDPDDGTALAIDTWTSCAEDVELRRVIMQGAGHTWPGQGSLLEGIVGNVSYELDGTDYVLAWLSRFSR